MDLRKTRGAWQELPARLVLAMLIVLCAIPATAGAGGLYAGTAAVASQSDEDRAVALRAALGQVIVKLSGNDAVLSRPDVVHALAKADHYMQSYGYQNDPAQPSGHMQLVVEFDHNAVDSLLHDLGLDAGAAPPAPVAPPAADSVLGAAAPAPASSGSYRLWITGLRSAEDYARLIGGLNANDQVRSLLVEQGRGNTVQVRIDARGTLPALLDALDAARLAHVSNAHPPVAGVDALLDFES